MSTVKSQFYKKFYFPDSSTACRTKLIAGTCFGSLARKRICGVLGSVTYAMYLNQALFIYVATRCFDCNYWLLAACDFICLAAFSAVVTFAYNKIVSKYFNK